MLCETLGESRGETAARSISAWERLVRRPTPGNESRQSSIALGGGSINIAWQAVDRHAETSHRTHIALRWLGRSGMARLISYSGLRDLTNQFANVLVGLDIGKGDRVAVLTGRIPELYVAALGTMKNRSVFCPLFSNFGPEPIRTRLELGDARVLVTTDRLYLRKIAPLRALLPRLEYVLIVGEDGPAAEIPGTLDLAHLMAAASDRFTIPPTDPEDMAVLHFTSGTTGRPKGAIHVHGAVAAHHASARHALDLTPGDVFWCTADPGWVTGTSYGIIGPLTIGATLVVDQEEFDAERWLHILEEEQVTVWYTAPTAIRMLMRMDPARFRSLDTTALRYIASVGEPLEPAAVHWGEAAFGQPIHDTWWQTETGAIMIANGPGAVVKPGSFGRPLPGVEAAIVHRCRDGGVALETTPDTPGELALRAGWPSMFRGYLAEPGRYNACFRDGWYLTGDLARRDADGDYWFIGRADDVIKSAGHLISPGEVEAVLREHPAVADAAVVGLPDPLLLQMVKAFIVLKEDRSESESVRRDILGHARRRLGAAVAPREITFKADLPKTRSGKLMRRLLKARELGIPEGDRSSLIDDGA
ncbi:MAG: acetate--CoA ligase [Azospirillum sp.]|nr:acetate--CoA ligase [Azospirillum sp.]